jgi:hypothetical protein
MIDPSKNVHFIASPAHRKALDQLEATLITAEAWLKPALTAVPCQAEFHAFLNQLAAAKSFLLYGRTS